MASPGKRRYARRRAAETLRLMAEKWPALFAPPGLPPPLAVGIRDMIAGEMQGIATRARVGPALVAWTGADAYLRALAQPGAWRHSLDGARVEPVSREHQAHARAVLDERRAATAEARSKIPAAARPRPEGQRMAAPDPVPPRPRVSANAAKPMLTLAVSGSAGSGP